MILRPLENFTIVRGLEDHTDSSTYYVRAVIRNARTDVLIDTVELSDMGDGHRFSKSWRVPADTSGMGFYISICTSVYTDSGYTTKAQNYGDVYNTYLVDQRNVPLPPYDTKIDYKKIDQMIADHLKAIPQPKIEFPKVKEVKIPEIDLTPVNSQILALQRSLEAESKKINALLDSLEGKDEDKINSLAEEIKSASKTINNFIKENDSIKSGILKQLTDLQEQVKKLTDIKNVSPEDIKPINENSNKIGEMINDLKTNLFPPKINIPFYRRKLTPSYRKV